MKNLIIILGGTFLDGDDGIIGYEMKLKYLILPFHILLQLILVK